MSSEQPRQPTEEELRAAYEAELKKLRVEDLLIQTVVSLVNLGGRKAGLAPGTEDERDPAQLQKAIDATRALLPFVEEEIGPDAQQIRNALSQLQMAFAQQAQAPQEPGEQAEEKPPEQGEGPGPAQSSGKLWVPGQ
jgi:hypothetical protein